MRKLIILFFAAGVVVLAGGCATNHKTVVYEYVEVWQIKKVNELARQGWVVVGYSAVTYPKTSPDQLTPESPQFTYLLRREKN